jgi:hypothetical protein
MRSFLGLLLIAVAIWFAVQELDSAPSERVTGCLASTEQTILLRQLNLTGQTRRTFDSCLEGAGNINGFCQALYLNANGAVRECMKQVGYIFLDADYYGLRNDRPLPGEDVCSYPRYTDPKCYHRAWWFAITHWLSNILIK